jgi:predicted RNase H-like HicB family nuclease
VEYTVLLTNQPGPLWRATVPWLPDCVIEAPTRTEALEKIQQCISDVVNHTEVLRVQVPDAPKMAGGQLPIIARTPWQWFGVFRDDPTWSSLFDAIEQQRNEHMIEG